MNKMLDDIIALIEKNDAVDVIKSSKRHYELEMAANGELLRAIEHWRKLYKESKASVADLMNEKETLIIERDRLMEQSEGMKKGD